VIYDYLHRIPTQTLKNLENLENNKLIFQVLEISCSFTKNRKCPGKTNIACEKIHFVRTEKPVNKYYICRRKLLI